MRVKTRNTNGPDGGGIIIEDADEAAVACVLNADPESDDGRSQWVWVRLPNGDLILATFPQGDTYFEAWEGQQVRENT